MMYIHIFCISGHDFCQNVKIALRNDFHAVTRTKRRRIHRGKYFRCAECPPKRTTSGLVSSDFFSLFLKATRTRQETLKFLAQNAPAFAAAG